MTALVPETWRDKVAGCPHQPRPWGYGLLGNVDGFQRLAPRQRSILHQVAARGLE